MIEKPFLALCEDRSKLPKNHPTSGSPDEWFSNSILGEFGLFGFTGDFFINWGKPPKLSKEFWIKLLINDKHDYEAVIKSLPQAIFGCLSEDYLATISRIIRGFGLELFIILFKDNSDWNSDSSALIKIRVDYSSGKLQFENQKISLKDLKEQIQTLSGGPISIGAKGLIYGTSRLECALSKTNSLYPGDVDLIVVQKEDVKAILEFKKHNKSSKIENQTLSNYYPTPDQRKYDRLAILRDALTKNNKRIPIITVFYPTLAEEKNLKLEIVIGEINSLKAGAHSICILPTNSKEHSEIAKSTLGIIETYYKELK